RSRAGSFRRSRDRRSFAGRGRRYSILPIRFAGEFAKEGRGMKTFWDGVIPAITTPFKADGSVDHAFFAKHVGMMMDAGCTAIVPLGSLGETATLSAAEKKAVLETCVKAVGKR